MELLDVTGVGVDGMMMTTKPIVDGAQQLLDDLVPLPEVLKQFVVLFQHLTHQSPILLDLMLKMVSLKISPC